MAVAEVTRSARDRHFEAAVGKLRAGVQAMTAWVGEAEAEGLGEALIQIREAGIDPLESVFADGVRRFDKSGEYKADGALSLTAWLRWKCKLSGGAAMERVEIARQLEKLPQTGAAFANGDVGYQHVAVLARTAEHVGAAVVRKEEARCCRRPRRWTPASSPRSPRTSNTAWMRRAPWRRPTAPMNGATFTSASHRMGLCGSMACSMPRAAPRCARRC